ncbi:unnamed protein product [Brachionus calyciflorus]|uniref:C2H2-type domain-containing protein n=1 Tax=Brachionus calyciflorus TaxID=104777 RepID=A0A813MQE7_9BILA|nr:unnamed protein product [Brachionus calyciflorus]
MVNCIDNEKLLKNIITQFCDQNFKFTLNLKILGSIHVQVDNNEVLTCLLDEKFFKSAQNRSLITTNQNLFNPLSVVKPLSENNTALNLVTTLNQLQQQQQQLKLVNPSHLVPSVKTPSLSSSSSTSSKSSTSSASSFMSGDLKQHKRKRSNGQKSDDGSSASSVSCRSSRRENQNTDEEDEDEGNSSDHNENNEHENDNENEILNNSSANQTPVKRNKRDDGVETHDEAAAAAASALSLISAAAVASKLYNQQNLQNNQQAPQHNFHSITSHLNPYQSYQSNNNENEQPSSSSLPSSSSSVPVQTQKPLKPKTKYLMNDYEQQLKQQIFQQSIENTAQNFTQSQQYTNNSYNQIENDKKMDANEQEDHDSSLEESQLYMDEDNLNKNDKENEEQKPQISQIIQQENHSSISHLQQQQNLMMAAAAAALMNNNSVNQQVNGADNSNLKLFMPHSLALNLAAVKQQQQQQQIQQLQNLSDYSGLAQLYLRNARFTDNLNAPQLIQNLLNNSIQNLTNQTNQTLLNNSSTNQVQLSTPNTNTLAIKPFSCHKCQRTFNSKYNVIRHLKQYHADKRMFKCNICGRDYKWVDSLHKHMKLHKQQQLQQQIQNQLIEAQKSQDEEKADVTNNTLDSGVVVLDDTINEENYLDEEVEAELEPEINTDLIPDLDDDSLIILSPKTTNFEPIL